MGRGIDYLSIAQYIRESEEAREAFHNGNSISLEDLERETEPW